MSRYSKIKSKYIKREFHQDVEGGQILERDWYTTGSINNFGRGKSIAYSDGNFIFTRSNVRRFPKQANLGNNAEVLTYDDVKSASAKTNSIILNSSSNDMRDFAYYGSCIELVRSSIENIIKEFPGCIYASRETVDIPPIDEDGDFTTLKSPTNKTLYLLKNSFNIDLYHDGLLLEETDNYLRYLSLSYRDYLLNDKPIIDMAIEYGDENDCPADNEWYSDNPLIIVTTLKTETETVKLYGYQIERNIVFFSEKNGSDGNDLLIKPNDDIIESYFSALEGFEKQLLNRNSNPLYSNEFVTPYEANLTYVNVTRKYTWPSVKGYCIDIESTSYIDFINKLSDLANKMDELWCDNLYRNMTHEAIKNFDWTFTRDYADGEEEDNINGGEVMKKILHVMAKVFDDAKITIDGIKSANKVTYSSYNNVPDSMLTDNLMLEGWDVKSIASELDGGNDEATYTTDWYPTKDFNRMTPQGVENEFMRRLTLSGRRLLSSKGTSNAIDMIMGLFGFGENDYSVNEYYYKVIGQEIQEDSTLVSDIILANTQKKYQQNYVYEDKFYGIPLTIVIRNGKNYLVPNFDSEKKYDGDLYFQCNGGWGALTDNMSDVSKSDYMETVPYLRTATNIEELLQVNAMSVRKGDMYSVYDLSDIVRYDEDVDISELSHIFVLVNEGNPFDIASWWNVSDKIDNSYLTDNNEKEEYRKQAEYLQGIVNDNLGNNPHVGYGRYDCGKRFKEYLQKPFKYSIDKHFLFGSKKEVAESLEFDILEETDNSNEKIFSSFEGENNGEFNINSKIVVLENKLEDEGGLYSKFFINVIFPYLSQVIPSTTILVLYGFNNGETLSD